LRQAELHDDSANQLGRAPDIVGELFVGFRPRRRLREEEREVLVRELAGRDATSDQLDLDAGVFERLHETHAVRVHSIERAALVAWDEDAQARELLHSLE
jgi:hypothetical protein